MSSTTDHAYAPALPAIEIARMNEHDLLEVVEIEERSGLSRWGWSAYYAELQSHNGLMFVARVVRPLEQVNSYNLAGYIVARAGAGEIHINNVAVRDEFRRKGLGSQLLKRILEEGSKMGADAAFLEVRSGNSAAQALYERCGFEPLGRRRNYYTEPIEDALTMRADLKQ
jgi:[ribosomal protein S18]-alanine N-acetyltransferase